MNKLNNILCTGCDKIKLFKDFSKNINRKNGINGECKSCQKEYRLQHIDQAKQYNINYRKNNLLKLKEKRLSYRMKNTDKIKKSVWANKLRNRYGLTPEVFFRMIENQMSKCAICNNERKLVIDHCHKTGKVRGMLCHKCNWAIGLLSDEIKILENAINYLKRNE